MIKTLIDIFSRFSAFDPACQKEGFLGFPAWYKYLDSGPQCAPVLGGLNDIWLIVLAIVEILLRLAAIAAIVFIVYAGIRYITARGNPEKLTSARIAIQDALIGLVITIVAIALVSFVGGRVS